MARKKKSYAEEPTMEFARESVEEAVPAIETMVAVEALDPRTSTEGRVVLHNGNAYIVPFDAIQEGKVGPVKLSNKVIDSAEQADSMKGIIKQALPSVEDVQEALWRAGVIRVEQLSDKTLVHRALRRVLPDAYAFNNQSK